MSDNKKNGKKKHKICIKWTEEFEIIPEYAKKQMNGTKFTA